MPKLFWAFGCIILDFGGICCLFAAAWCLHKGAYDHATSFGVAYLVCGTHYAEMKKKAQ
jgi:hypothetical protein